MRTHGHTVRAPDGSRAPTKMYLAWRGILNRSRHDPSYVGVGVDPRWESFEGFLKHPPAGTFSPGMSVARKGDTGDYTPENCEWKTKQDNGREAAEPRMIRLEDGRFAADVAREHGIPRDLWYGRWRKRGWPLLRAVTEPKQRP